MKALVISGGGSKGAFAGGVAELLINNLGRDYNFIIGTSTGSLLAPLLAIGEIDRLKACFTNVTQKNIFHICPFRIQKKKGLYKIKMNHFGILRMFLRGKKTFGDSTNLKKFIKTNFTEIDFKTLKKSGKTIIVTVANLTNYTVEYKSSDDYTYDEFCDWIWASANLLPFMSLFEHNHCEYGDGGFGDVIPIQKAINLGATEVDVIALRPLNNTYSTLPSHNAFNLLTKTYNFMLNQIGLDDLMIGKLEAQHKNVDIHFYHTPYILTEHMFIFDSDQLSKWWEEGYEVALHTTPKTECIHPKNNNR